MTEKAGWTETTGWPTLLDQVIEVVERGQYHYANEAELQTALAQALGHVFDDVQREVRLDSRNRIDILVQGAIGIEVKVKGNQASALKQVLRYTAFPHIAAVVLVTNRAQRSDLPLEFHGKPVRVVSLLHRGL